MIDKWERKNTSVKCILIQNSGEPIVETYSVTELKKVLIKHNSSTFNKIRMAERGFGYTRTVHFCNEFPEDPRVMTWPLHSAVLLVNGKVVNPNRYVKGSKYDR